MTESQRTPNAWVTPELRVFGEVRTLTRLVSEKCSGSADAILPRDVPQADGNCVIDSSTGPG